MKSSLLSFTQGLCHPLRMHRQLFPGPITAFHAEAGQRNGSYAIARNAVRQYFIHEAAAFLGGPSDEQQRLRADLVSVAQSLLGK